MSAAVRLCVCFLIGLFWSLFVTIQQIVLFFKNGLKYFHSGFLSYPKSLFSSKYEHNFAPLNTGVTLHYVSCGNKSAPLLLFVHGFPEFWYTWRYQMDYFQKNFHVVAIDLRGYGLSDKPQAVDQYKVDLLVDDIHQLLNHLGVARCHLVCHDWGGIICWRFAQEYSQLIERFVILNCPHPQAFNKMKKNKSLKQFLKSWYMFFFQLPCYPEWILSRLQCQGIADAFTKPPMGLRLNTFTQEEIDAFRANFTIPGTITAAVNYYRALFRYGNKPRQINLKALEKLPTLLIWGDADGALSPELAQMSKEFCPQLQVEMVPGASHWVQQDAPDLVNSIMDKFFTQPLSS